MFELSAYLWSGATLLTFAVFFWVVSLVKNDVSIVDSLWSIMFLLAAAVYALMVESSGPRETLILALTAIWAVRLSAYITWRNHGEPEDYRYQEIRRNNEPGFRYKSLYIVFILQAFLAWVISLPLAAAISSPAELGLLDYAGILLCLTGILFETLGDLQLSRFKSNPANRDKVLDYGLWRLSRHPNYFGNFTLWWGFFLISLSSGEWWTIVSPLLMSFLLLKVSGVALLEKDIGDRRPDYQDYIRRTNAFFPGPRRP
ncbi:MAG: steroid 5-alpha reductase family enzyme [Lysobacterales bacterium]|jgi:steroid 5-alpha reductase family enzyme